MKCASFKQSATKWVLYITLVEISHCYDMYLCCDRQHFIKSIIRRQLIFQMLYKALRKFRHSFYNEKIKVKHSQMVFVWLLIVKTTNVGYTIVNATIDINENNHYNFWFKKRVHHVFNSILTNISSFEFHVLFYGRIVSEIHTLYM